MSRRDLPLQHYSPAEVVIYLAFGSAFGAVVFFITLNLFDSHVRPRFFPRLPSFSEPRVYAGPLEEEQLEASLDGLYL